MAPVSPATVLGVFVGALGLIVGSYLNVVVYRLPREISTVFPRSRCPRCRAPIGPLDNVPLLSFLLLRGRCRHCANPIPWRYPLVEATTALLFLACFRRFEGRLETAVALALGCALVVLAAIDVEHYLLPDAITLPGLALGLALQAWIALRHLPPLPWATPLQGLVGAAAGAGVLLAVSWGWYLLRGVFGMGLGDVKMLAMIGAVLGWQGVLITLLFGSLGGSLAGAALMLRGRMGLQSKLPFGFFLAAGALVALLWGRALADAYLGAPAAGEIWSLGA